MSSKQKPHASICCIKNCKSHHSKILNIKYYKFPRKGTNKKEQRDKWIEIVRKVNSEANWCPTSTTRICNYHFVWRRKSKDPNSSSFVPILFYGNAEKRTETTEPYENRQRISKVKLVMNEGTKIQKYVSTEVTKNEKENVSNVKRVPAILKGKLVMNEGTIIQKYVCTEVTKNENESNSNVERVPVLSINSLTRPHNFFLNRGGKKCCLCGAAKSLTVRLYSFPRSVERAKKWLDNCGLDGICDPKEAYTKLKICGKHFSDNHYTNITKYKLNKFAVPFLVSWKLLTTQVIKETENVCSAPVSKVQEESEPVVPFKSPETDSFDQEIIFEIKTEPKVSNAEEENELDLSNTYSPIVSYDENKCFKLEKDSVEDTQEYVPEKSIESFHEEFEDEMSMSPENEKITESLIIDSNPHLLLEKIIEGNDEHLQYRTLINDQTRNVIKNVFNFMKKEAETGLILPVGNFYDRVLTATGIDEIFKKNLLGVSESPSSIEYSPNVNNRNAFFEDKEFEYDELKDPLQIKNESMDNFTEVKIILN